MGKRANNIEDTPQVGFGDIAMSNVADRPSKMGRVLVAVFALIAAIIAYLGSSSPGISEGNVANKRYVARVKFKAINRLATERTRNFERNKVLSRYSRVPSWQKHIRERINVCFSVTKVHSNIETAHDRIKILGDINVDPTPLIQLFASAGGAQKAENAQLELQLLVEMLAKRGVMADRHKALESSHGRLGIELTDGQIAPLSDDGLLNLSEAKEIIRTTTRSMFASHPKLAAVLANAINQKLVPSLQFEEEQTARLRDMAAAEVKDIDEIKLPGERLALDGDVISPEQFELIKREAIEYNKTLPLYEKLRRFGGVWVLFSLFAWIFAETMRRLAPGAIKGSRQIIFLGILDVAIIALARGLELGGYPALLTPFALIAAMFAPTTSRLAAILNTLLLGLGVLITSNGDVSLTLALIAGGVVASHAAAGARRRSELLRAGVFAGAAQFITIFSIKVAFGCESLTVLLDWGGYGLLGGVLSGLASLGALPLAEMFLGVTTDISLLELSDQDHPVLRRLLREAPGTYHHSMIVGNLAESAALALGANALLARVASYYHDIGKIDRPEYFVENQAVSRNRHDNLSPAMSTLIITSHVRDGVSTAREHGLPNAIGNIICQHHGTGLVEYFYRRAEDRLRASGEKGEVDEQSFRYLGPKPQTREAAIVLLADTVEAASRSLDEPTSARLSKLVHDLTMKRLLDGQFDEANITLKDLRIIQDVFVKVLASMFHSRIPYPKAPTPNRRGR